MRISLIYNRKAGGALAPKKLKALLRKFGHTLAHSVDKSDSWKDLAEDPGEMVVIAGGDGTVGAAAVKLAPLGVPLAILPTGTANNIAGAMGIQAASPEEHVASWEAASPRQVDIGVASGPWGVTSFIEGVGFGLLATCMAQLHAQDKRSDAKRDDTVFKLFRDRLALKALAPDYRPMALTGAVDGVGLQGAFLLVEALNIRSVGPGIDLVPDADPGDGLLDFAFVSAGDREALVDYLAQKAQGADPPSPAEIHRGRVLTLTAPRHDAHVDDRLWRAGAKPPAVHPDVEIKAQAQTVMMLAPPLSGPDLPDMARMAVPTLLPVSD
ncbi:hypothetical protein FHP25_09090 [Vineibacter terrae]|uniref:DAGKc domain-containing protein n=1 Tax=Vineibacter terrae TaxID=2586908 RepID=A0A5C8PRE7_9HYPH|nr:diacylglycerol kinase family protein [Vineibacter terrae]TXL77575.1 hypothetical protein FHP25_09090 [Vineibacter terrae]